MTYVENAIEAIKEAKEHGRFYGTTISPDDVRRLLNGDAPEEVIDILVNASRDVLDDSRALSYVLLKIGKAK